MAGYDNVGFFVVSGHESERTDDGNAEKKRKTHGQVENGDDDEQLILSNHLGNQKPKAESVERDHQSSTLKMESSSIKPSIVDETCHISRLPPEILSKIFSHFWWWKHCSVLKYNVVRESWGALRLVCKLWYDLLSHDVSLEISSSRKLQWASQYLINSPFQWLNLYFVYDPYNHDILTLEVIPKTLWETIGAKIRELRLCHVQLGNEVMKNMITNCDNLQTLVVTIEAFNMNQTFCLPSMLERLKVEQKNLRTLEIVMDYIYGSDMLAFIKYNFGRWKRIFAAFIRIFPNITHFRSSSGYTYDSDGWRKFFDCSFSKDLQEIKDQTSVAECLAYALSDNTLDWNRAIEALNRSGLRLTAIQFHYSRSRYMENCKSALLHFFANQKQLKSVEIEICNFELTIDRELLKSLLIQIVESGHELCELRYCLLDDSDHDVEDVDLIHWLHTLSQYIKPLNLREFSTGCIVSRFFKSLYLGHFRPMPISKLDQKIRTLFLTYSHIEHLNCHWLWTCSDEIFQFIFHHMTNLTDLKLNLNNNNTDFALTGHLDESENPENGYSINRLQNLEQLTIGWENSESNKFSDAIFYEFNFPKLSHLSCVLPKNLSVLADIGPKMPSLEKVVLRKANNVPLKPLVDFCQTTKDLKTLSIDETHYNLADAEELFKVCPSLRTFKTKSDQFYYEPFSKEVRCKSGSRS